MEAPIAAHPLIDRPQVERPAERLQMDRPARESSNDDSVDSGSNPQGDTGFYRGGFQVQRPFPAIQLCQMLSLSGYHDQGWGVKNCTRNQSSLSSERCKKSTRVFVLLQTHTAMA